MQRQMDTVSKRTPLYTIEYPGSNHDFTVPIKLHCQNTVPKVEFTNFHMLKFQLTKFHMPKELYAKIPIAKMPFNHLKKWKIWTFLSA